MQTFTLQVQLQPKPPRPTPIRSDPIRSDIRLETRGSRLSSGALREARAPEPPGGGHLDEPKAPRGADDGPGLELWASGLRFGVFVFVFVCFLRPSNGLDQEGGQSTHIESCVARCFFRLNPDEMGYPKGAPSKKTHPVTV